MWSCPRLLFLRRCWAPTRWSHRQPRSSRHPPAQPPAAASAAGDRGQAPPRRAGPGRWPRQCDGGALYRALRRLPRRRPERRPRPEPVRRHLGPRHQTTSRSPRRSPPGVPNTEMVAVQGSADDVQIWQLVAYLKTQAREPEGASRSYVPDPDGQVIKSEKQDIQDRNRGAQPRDAVGPRVPAGWPPAHHRASRPPAHLARGSCCRKPVKGTPKVWERQDGGLFDVEVHPQYAKNGWIYLSYAEPGPNNVAPPSMAAAAAAGLLPQRGGGGGGAPAPAARLAPRRPARRQCAAWRRGARNPIRPGAAPAAAPRRGQHLEHGHRPRQDQREERVGRAAGHLPRASRSCTRPSNVALRLALHLRPRRAPVLHPRRARPDDQRAGPVEPARQDPSRQRRRDRFPRTTRS